MASDDREWLVYHIAQADDLPREMIRAMPDDHRAAAPALPGAEEPR